MTTIGIGLIGLGRHGLRYATHLLEGAVPGAGLVAVCRRDQMAGAAYASQHGIRFHPTPDALIEDPKVEAVIVVTPPALTLPIALEAVRRRKALLIEKPLACRGMEAAAIVQATDAATVPLMVAQTLRFDSAIHAMRAELSKIGTLHYLTLTNRVEPRPEVAADLEGYGGRGVLLEIGIHLLDLIRLVTDDEVAAVRCETDCTDSGRPESRAFATLRTVKGLSCLLDVSRVSGGRVSRAECVGSRGQVMADWIGHRVRLVVSRDETHEWETENRPTIVATVAAFVDSLQRGLPMTITGKDGQRAVEIADACYRSAITDQWTVVDRA